MNTILLEILRSANPWLTSPRAFPKEASHHFPKLFIPRVLPMTSTWPVEHKAHLVVGARQVGKSSFLWNWFATRRKAPLFINAEEPLVQDWLRSPTLVLKDLKGLLRKEMPIFIDEAQHLDEAGLLIKGLVDGGLHAPLFITGSSSFHLRAKTRESLAGRAIGMKMHPFSLEELCWDLDDLPELIEIDDTRKRAKRQFVFGGYPEAWLSNSPREVLGRLVNTFVLRDASDIFKIQNVNAFRKLLHLLAGQTGNLVNFSEWASICGVSRKAISNYVDILEESHIVRAFYPFVGGKRAELTSRPKIYFCDTGILAAAGAGYVPFDERPDRGPLFESWVAAELNKHVLPFAPSESLGYWRTKSGAEVDFVVDSPAGLVGIEVKASEMKRPKLSRSSRSFIEAYAPTRFYVINLNLNIEEQVFDTTVRWIGPELFAKEARQRIGFSSDK
ncbi:MAG: ATP-binding protein [Proteobacteria bacterium]|nr:ATP-binding protein [Pseudomonadota bacterium]